MAEQDYAPCEKRLIDSEGTKYTDGVHPYDPGGPTRYGITLTDARLYWKPKATANDVRLMPITVALAIYKSKYWDKMTCDSLPPGLDYSVFDYGVNSGIGRSGKVLRRLVGLSDHTSAINADVLAAVAKRDAAALIDAMNAERLAFLKTLKIWPTYKNGWTTRVAGVEAFSKQLAANPALAATAPVLGAVDPLAPPPPTPVAAALPADAGTVKGMVPPATGQKRAVTGAATGSGGAAVVGWQDWILTHQGATAIIAACAIVLLCVVFKVISDRQAAKQDIRIPGTPVVPETA